jgi:hypothetical protein
MRLEKVEKGEQRVGNGAGTGKREGKKETGANAVPFQRRWHLWAQKGWG